jgi:hypothetical protein
MRCARPCGDGVRRPDCGGAHRTDGDDRSVRPGDATPTGGTELFLRQVPANTVEKVPVQGVANGTKVTFKAVTVDGSRTYQSRDVGLTGLYVWSVP